MKEKDDIDNDEEYSSESADSEENKNKKDITKSIYININKKNKENNFNNSDDTIKFYNENKNIDDDTINKCNSYKSVFSFANISKAEHPEFNNFNINNLGINKLEENERNSGLNNEISIWEAIKQQIVNVKNHIVFNFNIFSGLNNLKLNDEKLPQEIQIFDQAFEKQDDKLINVLKNIPWFSYRKNFNQIKEKDMIYTSDAGWGCMIRASQMILAQGIYKIFSMNNLNQFFNEFITFFYDNKIPLKLLIKNSTNNDFKKEKNKKKEIKNKEEEKEEETYNDFLIIDIPREFRISFVDVTKEMIKEFEILSNQENQEYITAPFSLRSIIKTQNKLNPNGKKVGQWFSNYDVMKIISYINEKMIEKQDTDFKIINFENETIYIEDLINNCFEEVETQGFEFVSKSNFDENDSILNYEINNKINNEFYIFNKRRYKFKQKFIIFISVRHGLHKLDEEIYKDVLNVFNIKTNIGLIGGKNSRAFYFIGKCGNNLIFLDPHYVQQTLPLNDLGTDKIEESYRPNDIYYMNISELSPSFSIGFAIKDMKDFKLFMEKITSDDYFIDQNVYKSFGKKNSYLFMVKNFHYPYRNDDDSNQDISNNIDIRDNYY
jgi:hypothetical protein